MLAIAEEVAQGYFTRSDDERGTEAQDCDELRYRGSYILSS
jgi:hypothetical protein